MGWSGNFKLGLLFVLLMFSCQKENQKTVVLLSPLDLYISAKSSEVVVIGIECNSPFELTNFSIKSRIQGEFSVVELDSSITGKEFNYQYEYLVPKLNEDGTIILEFIISDAAGLNTSNFRIIEVSRTEVLLTETAGNVLYSGNSTKHNGYNLILGIPEFTHLADTSTLHVADTTDTDILLKRWISPAGLKFVKFNGFDYANCTNISTRASYNAGIKSAYIDNLAEGDIYITLVQDEDDDAKDVYIALKIMNIIDNEGSDMDRYIFNIKK
jgi:hypothetical protein